MVTRRENCFEERLADLRARVAVADERGGSSQIVTVNAGAAARAGVVETENADHAEGQPPQRRQRAHGDATPEEVGTARHTLDPVGKEPADIGERDLDPRRLAADDGMLADLGNDPAELVELPLLGGAHVEELFDHIQQRVAPLSGSAVSPHVVCDRRETCDSVGQATGDGDVVTLDAERRDVARCEADVVVTHRHSHEHPVNRDPPRVGGEFRREAPSLPVRTVEAPAHVGPHDPIRDRPKGTVVEVEALADRRQRNELQHLRRGEPARYQREQRVERREDRVRLAQRTVGDAVEEPGRGAARHVGRLLGRDSEARLHQWHELVDRRGEHDDVLLAQRRVVDQQVEDRVAQHLDLAGAPVARVHLDRAVVGAQLEVAGGGAIGAYVVLHALEQRAGCTVRRLLALIDRLRRGQAARLGPRQQHGPLPIRASPRSQQRMPRRSVRPVVGTQGRKGPRAGQCRIANA